MRTHGAGYGTQGSNVRASGHGGRQVPNLLPTRVRLLAPWQLAGAALQLLREMTSRGISPDLVSSVASLR